MYAVIYWVPTGQIYPATELQQLITFPTVEEADKLAQEIDDMGYEARTISIEGVIE